jgi:DNA-binding response OmpR family regulator
VKLPINSGYLSEDEIVEAGLENEDKDLEMEVGSQRSQVGKMVEDRSFKKEGSGNGIKGERGLEVLIVEDNNDLRSFIRNILNQDYKVIEAVDGIDGFEQAEAAIPDLIVSDVMMPRMDGYDLCKKLKTNEKTNHIPVILLTAKAARENKLEGLETGADDYLVKPFDEEELKVRIKNLISIREKLQLKFQGEISLKPKEIKAPSVQQKFLDELKEIIEENIDNEQFGMEDLQKGIGMSRSQIHRKLKALTAQSATTFIRNYRLHRAVDLLNQDAGNITEIAYQVGFNSQTYFSSCFQELFGCSPSEFKQKA